MSTTELRDLIAKALERNRQIETLVVLGNSVHVYLDNDEEFEIVIKISPRPEKRWKDSLDGL